MGFGGPKSLFVTSESEEAPVFTEVALVVMIALEMVGATLWGDEVLQHNSTLSSNWVKLGNISQS